MAGRDGANGVKIPRRAVRLRNSSRLADVHEGILASCLGDLEAQPVVWLWGELVARGMVTSLTGPTGVGKSFVALDVAAAVTRGDRKTLRRSKAQSASTTTDAGDVLLISPEHELADVVRTRLVAAGAEMARIHAIHGIRGKEGDRGEDCCRPFQLNDDLPLLEQEIERRKTAGSPLRLIVVDPFLLEPFHDRSDAAEFISTMQQLAGIAAATDVAILLVVNCPAKARSMATCRVQTLESAAQSAWWIGGDPYRPERRLMLPVKINLVEKTPGRSFVLSNGRIQWESRPIWMNAERFQTEARERARLPLFEQEFSELARAMYWLQEYMGTDIFEFKHVKTAAEFVGFSDRTLRRAFCGLKGISWRMPGTNAWAWKLRDADVVNPHLPWTVDRFIYEESDDEYEEDKDIEQGDDGGTRATASEAVES